MAKKLFKKRPRRMIVRISVDCIFCKEKKEPSFKNYKDLSIFISERARIIGTESTGVCSTHQRKLTTEIKRARYLGLLPFAPNLS